MHRIGIDLGGTKIEGILLDQNNETIDRKRVPTHREDGYKAIISRISILGHELLEKSSGVERIGICTPGSVDPSEGVMKNSNTLCLIGEPLQKDLENSFDLPVFMENDANCFALAEAVIGAANGYGVVLVLLWVLVSEVELSLMAIYTEARIILPVNGVIMFFTPMDAIVTVEIKAAQSLTSVGLHLKKNGKN